MKAICIHGEHDLRIDEWAEEPLGEGQVEVDGRGRRHLRLRPPLLPPWRLRHGSAEATDGSRPRSRRDRPRRRSRRDVGSRRRHRCGQPEPCLRQVRLLPGRAPQSLPRHAFLRQRDALSACAGRLPRAARGRRGPMRAVAEGGLAARGGLCRAVCGGAPCDRQGRPAHGLPRAGDRKRTDRRAGGARRPSPWRGGDRCHRRRRRAARPRSSPSARTARSTPPAIRRRWHPMQRARAAST